MLNYLPDIYESTLQEYLSYNYTEIIPGLLQRTADVIIEECCQLIANAKNLEITIKCVTNFIDLPTRTVYIGYNIYLKEKNTTEQKFTILTFALPTAAVFNESPVNFYKNIMQQIWQQIKESHFIYH